jgi:hypothetical protein
VKPGKDSGLLLGVGGGFGCLSEVSDGMSADIEGAYHCVGTCSAVV